MRALYIFSRAGWSLSKVAKNIKGFYVVKGCSAALSTAAEVFRSAQWKEIHEELSFDFVREIRLFLSSLNEVNASRYWWTLNFTDKNPLASKFVDQVFLFCRVAETFNKGFDCPVAIITDDQYSIVQLKAWAKSKKIKVVDQSNMDFKWLLKQLIPVGPFFAFARAVIYHFHDVFVLGRVNLKVFKNNAVVLVSLVNSSSFKNNGYVDLYFEPLLSYLRENKKAYHVFALVLEPYKNCVKMLQRSAQKHSFVTINYSASLWDLVKCFLETFFRLSSPITWKKGKHFQGNDITLLVKNAIKEDLCSTKYFTNAVFYRSAIRLFNRVKPKSFIYPFEMHPWEKLMLMALREKSPQSQAIGYQHVAFTPRHLNLMFSERERAVLPFPDKIVTLGEITKNILLKINPFLKNTVTSGCALRQNGIEKAGVFSRDAAILTISVIMASSLDEHIGLIKLANACSSRPQCRCRFILRAHPTINFDQAIMYAGGLSDSCERSKGQLNELLKQSDIIMYTSSTVAIEALGLGKQVIHASVGDYISSDPLFDYNGLVYKIKNSDDFIEAISSFRSMSGPEFSDAVAEGIEYASKYFLEITRERLEIFLT